MDLNNIFSSYNFPKSSNNQNEQLEGKLTYDECLNTLKNIKHNKSPGNSGFTVKFYKMFWKGIGYF